MTVRVNGVLANVIDHENDLEDEHQTDSDLDDHVDNPEIVRDKMPNPFHNQQKND